MPHVRSRGPGTVYRRAQAFGCVRAVSRARRGGTGRSGDTRREGRRTSVGQRGRGREECEEGSEARARIGLKAKDRVGLESKVDGEAKEVKAALHYHVLAGLMGGRKAESAEWVAAHEVPRGEVRHGGDEISRTRIAWRWQRGAE